MKRRTVFGLLTAFCIACAINCSVWAQDSEPPAPTASPANDAQIEAAKKEVQDYDAKYEALLKKKGMAAALRSLLTPDYKQVDAFGKIITHDEYIGMFSDASPKERKRG